MLAIIAKPFDATLETVFHGPPYPFGVEPFGPRLTWSVFGGLQTLHLAESTFIGAPSDHVPSEPFAASLTLFAPPLPFGVGTFGPTLEYAAEFDAALRPADEDVSNVWFQPRLRQSLNFSVRLWEGDEPGGRSRPGLGAIEIANTGGELDATLGYGWDGRRIDVYEGPDDALCARTPFSAFQRRAMLSSEGIEWNQGLVTLRIKDPQARLETPLQPTLYAGTGGAEGGDDIKGRPKPVALGYCENVPAVPVDTTNLVYQIHYREIESIVEVRDKGVALTPAADRATYAALVAASIAAGAYDTCLAEGLFRLGAAPDGLVTADVEGDAPGGDYTETTGGILRRIATEIVGEEALFSDPDQIASSAFALLDALQPAQVGFFAAEPVSAASVFDRMMLAVGGTWGVTLLGQLTVKRLEVPAGAAADTLARRELGKDLRRQGAVPSWRRRIGYRPVWAVQSRDELADSVSAADKALYSEAFRFAVAVTAQARLTHARARDVTIEGFFAAEAAAADEAARQQVMFGAVRSIYSARVDRGPFANDLGALVALADLGRFEVADGQVFALIGITADRARGETVYELWG